MPALPPQLAVLASLEEPRTVKQLAEANALPYQAVYRAVQELLDRGILRSHREGKDLVVEAAAPAVPGLARSLLLDHARQDWGRVFHGDRPVVLHVLDRIGDPTLAAQVCGKTPRTVYYTIRSLGPRGLLVKRKGRYAINPLLPPLKALLEELAKAEGRRRLRNVDAKARPLWTLGPEVLFKGEGKLDGSGVHIAALSAFAMYSVPLVILHGSYYYLASRPLGVADAILQGLLVEPESRINRSYCALVFEKRKPRNLVKKARIYGLEEQAEALIRYVDKHEPGDLFLSWRDHDRYRRQYGVGA